MKLATERISIVSWATIALAMLIALTFGSGRIAIAKDPEVKPLTAGDHSRSPRSAPLKVVVTESLYGELPERGPMLGFTVDAVNSSGKAIRGFRGVLLVRDLFGDVVLQVRTGTSADIKNGRSEIKGFGESYDPSKPEHVFIRYTDFGDLQFNYFVEEINYADGETVRIPLPKRLQGR